MSYKIYKDQLDLFASFSKGRREIKQLFGKKYPSYSQFFDKYIGLVMGAREVSRICLMNEESNWHDNGCPTIFFEDDNLAKSLCLAKFDFENDFNVEPPFKTFAMSFPSGTVIAGVELTNCLVSIMTRNEFLALYNEKTPDYPLELQPGDYTGDELCIAVNYTSPDGLWHDRDFTHLVNYKRNVAYNWENKLPGQATELLSALTKIALAACVYNSATEGKKLIKGFPQSAITLPQNKTKIAYQGLTIGSAKEAPKKQNEGRKKLRYRIPHYRNLKADRYYRNQYANHKPGSRWILIEEYDPEEIAHTMQS